MTARATPPPEPYQESTDYSWTDKAFGMLEHGDLQGEVVSRDGIVSSRVQGPCPRCGHHLDDQQTHTALAGLMGGQSRGSGQPVGGEAEPVFFPVDVSCRCENSHPGAPAGTAGCGVSFRVGLPLRPDAGARP